MPDYHRKAAYTELYDQVLAILCRHDPVGVSDSNEESAEEYAPEVGTILSRLPQHGSVEEFRRIIHEEFVQWFSPQTAGPETSYQAIAYEVWAAWQRYQSAAQREAR
ncbi:MAG: hypothetical protein HY689_08755 [Chloroflexi bacterium]|nr:hypothetical protein [Chloroflexota bacterium]